MQNAKSEFLINRALAAAGAWSVRFWGSKLGAKTYQKTIKKWSQHGKASWHRFLIDFGGFWEASWEGKSSQEASKMASKKRWKNEGQQDGQKVATRSSNYQRGGGSRALGRPPPLRRDKPLSSPGPQNLVRLVLFWPLKSSKVLYSTWRSFKVL